MASQFSQIKTLVVDDHPVVLEGLRTILSLYEELDLVGFFSTGEEALATLKNREVDVALVDMRMKPLNGIELICAAVKVNPRCRFVVLSSYDLEEEVFRAVEAGASGYLSKDAQAGELIHAIKSVYRGDAVIPSYLQERIEHRRSRKELSAREREILELVAKGLTNKEIANVFGVSQFTVRNQLGSISTKLEVSDRTEAARVAIEQGIIIL